MVTLVDLRKGVGSTVHSKYIHIMDKSKCNRVYYSKKKMIMVADFFINVDLQITKQRRKKIYVIAVYKNQDRSVKRARLHIKSVVVGQVIVPVPVNIPATAPLLTLIPQTSTLTFYLC